jgi:hypothetical protein
MKTLNGTKQPDAEALKAKYLKCFGVRANSAMDLQKIVKRLVQQGVSRDILFIWGVNAGHPRTTVSSTLSRIFCALGLRKRLKGAGRKPSQDARELLDYARRQYGERALKVLRAALRAGRAPSAAGTGHCPPQGARADELIVVPHLGGAMASCSTAIRERGEPQPENFNRATQRKQMWKNPAKNARPFDIASQRGHAGTKVILQRAGKTFKRNGNTTNKSRNQTPIIRL